MPCSYAGESGDHPIEPECNTDLWAQKEYLGKWFELYILHNRERLDMQNFGDDTIVKESYIEEQKFITDAF